MFRIILFSLVYVCTHVRIKSSSCFLCRGSNYPADPLQQNASYYRRARPGPDGLSNSSAPMVEIDPDTLRDRQRFQPYREWSAYKEKQQNNSSLASDRGDHHNMNIEPRFPSLSTNQRHEDRQITNENQRHDDVTDRRDSRRRHVQEIFGDVDDVNNKYVTSQDSGYLGTTSVDSGYAGSPSRSPERQVYFN
jgi:hypothetical protein